jgi:hypothetical protein
MAWTLENLTALETSIAEGALKVEYGDKKVEYRSLNEMIKIRDLMRQSLGLLPPRRSYAEFSKGLNPCDE